MNAVSANAALTVLSGQPVDPAPVWLMRQAGRYLPEYRALRAEKGSFLALASDSDAACEVTLQPIRRFGFDIAILFSDILIVPWAMGQALSFAEGEGPRLNPPLKAARLEDLSAARQHYLPVFDTVRKVRAGLAPDKALFGCCIPMLDNGHRVSAGVAQNTAVTVRSVGNETEQRASRSRIEMFFLKISKGFGF